MQDPLSINIPLANVETTLPVLQEGDYQLQVVESFIDANKDNNGLNWNLTLALINPGKAIDDREVKPNHKIFHAMACQPRSDSKDTEAYQRSLGEAIDALFGTDKSNRPALTHALVQEAVGKMCLATVIVDEWKGNKNNKVRRLKKVA